MKKNYYPMLAKDGTIISYENGLNINSEYFNKPGRIGEIKYDGSRYILQRDEEGKAHLTSRNISVKDQLPVDKTENLRSYLYDDALRLAGITIDGEICIKKDGKIIGSNGSSEVNKIMLSAPEKAKELLQNTELVYVVYDILSFMGVDLTKLPLRDRKLRVEDALIAIDNTFNFAYSHLYIMSMPLAHSKESFQGLLDQGYEGMMIKELSSPYVQGEHSKHRIKVKKQITEDGIIIGGKRGTGKYNNTLGALVIGQYFSDGTLREVCTLSGMTDNLREYYRQWLCDMVVADKGLMTLINGDITLYDTAIDESKIIEFIAQEKTTARYRHPRFLQERGDKPARECTF